MLSEPRMPHIWSQKALRLPSAEYQGVVSDGYQHNAQWQEPMHCPKLSPSALPSDGAPMYILVMSYGEY